MSAVAPQTIYAKALNANFFAKGAGFSILLLLPYDELQVYHGEYEADQENHHRHRAAEAELEALQPELVEIGHHGFRGVHRIALAHGPYHVEYLHRSQNGQEHRDGE